MTDQQSRPGYAAQSNKAEQQSQRAFLIVSQVDPDTLSAIVKDEKTTESYLENGHDVRQVDVTDVGNMLIYRPMLYSKMDDAAWEAVSESLKAEHPIPSDAELPSGIRPTPMDLPSSVAASRLSFLAQHPATENAQSLVELAEVLRAADEYRAPDPAKFSDQSKAAPSWASTANGSFGELEALEDAIRGQISKSATLGRDYSAAMNELSEVSFLIEGHPDNSENEPGPSM